jgi:hypothetical protein
MPVVLNFIQIVYDGIHTELPIARQKIVKILAIGHWRALHLCL